MEYDDLMKQSSSPLEFENGDVEPWRSPTEESEILWCPCPGGGSGGVGGDHAPPPSDFFAAADGPYRALQDEPDEPVKAWEIAYMCIVLFIMFVALISDRVGADHVMVVALTMCMAAGIITVEEGIAGFANEGLLTVLVLFVVAAGISLTGALDWYMGKLLGRPKNAASAQLRLMVPIAIISAFLNNTPVVAVMIPIVQRWGKNIGVSPQQLLVPLSFASILGGTCTLIGTSTNLVVVGLLKDMYPDSPQIGLFDLGQFGVPVMFAGIAYILVAAPFLLPGGKRSRRQGGNAVELPSTDAGSILLGARLTKWSPAAGRSVQRSGLRDTGGIYLVSVHRAATGNIHRAVGPDFILNVGDVLFFTGLVETFGEFCEEHGLEVVTNEVEDVPDASVVNSAVGNGGEVGGRTGSTMFGVGGGEADAVTAPEDSFDNEREKVVQFSEQHTILNASLRSSAASSSEGSSKDGDSGRRASGFGFVSLIRRGSGSAKDLTTISENEAAPPPPLDIIDVSAESPRIEDIGTTKESLIQSDVDDRWCSINRMTDMIRGISTSMDADPAISGKKILRRMDTASSTFEVGAPAKIVVVTDASRDDDHPLVVVAINAPDRPGLLLDISKGLLRLGIQLHHSEASVIMGRSLSIWRCEVQEGGVTDMEEIWSVLNALLEVDHGIEAIKRRGLRVIRAVVTPTSRLIGRTASEVGFRETYRAAIVAVQQAGKNTSTSQVRFAAGDILVLQASDDSPLLVRPPADFYRMLALEESAKKASEMGKRKSSIKSLVNLVSRTFSSGDVRGEAFDNENSGPCSDSMKACNPRSSPKRGGAESEATKKDNAEEGGDSGFFIPDGSESDEDNGVEIVSTVPKEANDSSTSLDAVDEEAQVYPEGVCEVWRDLQVIFLDESDEDATNQDTGTREFLTAMEVTEKSGLANKTAAQSGIDKLPGVTLVSIERPVARVGGTPPQPQGRKRGTDAFSLTSSIGSVDGSTLTDAVPLIPVPTDEPVMGGDIIWFAGSATAVGDLRKIPGLKSYESEEVQKMKENIYDRRLVQAVVARKGPLVGKTVKEVRFRTRYGAAVIAVHREGKRLHEHPGNVNLHAGDVLLLEAGPTFLARSADNAKSFALLSEVEDSAPPRLRLLIPALILAIAMLAVFTAGVASLLVCALVAAIIMVLIGVLSQQEARDAINWEIYVTIACAFGIGTALTNSGVAGGVANALVALGEAVNIGDAGLFGAVYFATFLISNVVTNNAAAALIFPIAMDAAEQFGTDRLLMSYCIMLGASASFMSPFGYTTNLLIYGPGGYKYKDFLAMGTPMQLVLWILSVAVLSQGDALPWYLSWIVTFAFLVFVSLILAFNVTPKTIAVTACKCNKQKA